MAWHPTWNDDDDRREGRFQYVDMRQQWARRRGGGPGGRSVVTTLLIANIAVFLVELLGGRTGAFVIDLGALQARAAIEGLQLWRFFTFQFLHGSTSHIFWNMFGLWMFGRVVEPVMGPRRFLWMYLLCGVVGGVGEVGLHYTLFAMGQPGFIETPIVGASAGVCGVLIAFAILNPNAQILLFFIVPIRAKWAALGYAVMTTVWAFSGLQSGARGGAMGGVAHAAHLGGMLCAFVWMVMEGFVHAPWAYAIRRAAQGIFGRSGGGGGGSGPRSQGTWRHPVVGGPNEPGGRTQRPSPKAGPTPQEEQRLDRILMKIHRSGLASLSEEEREFLRRMSDRQR